MSAGYNSDPQTISVPASGDLSSSQFYLVKINTSGQLAVGSSRGERVHGVLLDDPAAASRAGLLCYSGVAQVECGGTFQEGDPLTTDANGKAVKADQTGDVVIGTAVEAGASGARASMMVGVAGGAIGNPQQIIIEDFENNYEAASDPLAYQADGTAAQGVAQTLNVLPLQGSNWAYAALGTQTITTPVVITDAVNSLVALNIGMDQTNDDGVEIFTHHWPATGTPFVIGKSNAFYMLLKFSIQDVSGTDDFHFGFRKVQALQAAWDDYTDAATFHINGTTLNTETILNNAATTTTDTTDAVADAARTYTMKVLVSGAGVVTFQHDITTEGTLAAPTAAGTFTFDDGDMVIPHIFFLHAADVAGEVAIYKYEVGFQ